MIYFFNIDLYVIVAPSTTGQPCWFGLRQPGITGAYFYYSFSITLTDCELECLNEEMCVAFSFINITLECKLHDDLETVSNDESAYYQKHYTTIIGKLCYSLSFDCLSFTIILLSF